MYFQGWISLKNKQKLKPLIHIVNTLLLSDNYVLGTGDTKVKFMFSAFKVFIIQ